MSLKSEYRVGDFSRPTPPGARRRPRDRQLELRRPPQVHSKGVETSIMRMLVIERLREEGFSPS